MWSLSTNLARQSRLSMVPLLLCAAFLTGCPRGELVLSAVLDALSDEATTEVILDQQTDAIRWVEVRFSDTEVPLVIDVLVKRWSLPTKTVYLLPASGTNARASFFTPQGQGLADYYANQGYLVVAITPREDQVAADADHTVLAEWGIEAHRRDVRKIVRTIQRRVALPYDMVGHSFTSAVVLDYAARFNDGLQRIGVLDFYHLNPAQADMIADATRLYQGFVDLAAQGIYADTSLADLSQLILAAAYYPDADSGVPRAMASPLLEGNFTYAGLLHFWMVYTGPLPGVHTQLTGLPRDWPLVMSTLAGYYQPGLSPADDTFGLSHVDVSTMVEVASVLGSGTLPLALMRDCAALSANNGAYSINWAGITEEVVWVNMELGYGDMAYAAELIEAGGNSNVRVTVVPGYGNGDPLYSRTAANDVWAELVGP